MGKVFPHLEAQPSLEDLDAVVSDYIELQWCLGEAVNDIADCLSGLHFFLASDKGVTAPIMAIISLLEKSRVAAACASYHGLASQGDRCQGS